MKNLEKQDKIFVVILLCVVCLCASLSLLPGSFWGDDFAAYISDGIAIAEGTIEEKITINPIMHPSDFVFGYSELNELVYVRGMSLIYALIYRLAGFDVDGGNLIWYKLPNVLFLALSAWVFYTFLRKRDYTPAFAFLLTLLFALHRETLALVDNIGVDVPYCFFSLLSVNLMEDYIRAMEKKRRLRLAAALGISLWLGMEIRLNGSSLLPLFGYLLVLDFFRKGKKMPQLSALLPFVIPLCGKLLLNCFLPAPTSNMGDVFSFDFFQLVDNISYYPKLIACWFSELILSRKIWKPFVLLWAVPVLLLYLGFCKAFMEKENAPAIFTLGTFLVLILLPYEQEYRYFLNILPYLVYFAAEGWKMLSEKAFPGKNLKRELVSVLSAMLVIGCTNFLYQQAETRKNRATDSDNGFNEDMLAMNAYIRENTPEDSVISCYKPRLLYLTTHRIGTAQFATRYLNDNPADYFLACPADRVVIGMEVEEEPVYENETMALYKRKE